MTKGNRTVDKKRSNLDRQVSPNTQPWLNWGVQNSFSSPVISGSLWSHSVVEITPKVTLRRKLLSEIALCQLTSTSECDSTIQKCLIDIQSDDEARAIMHTDSQIFGLSGVQWAFSRTLGKIEAIITGVSHDVFCWARCLPSTAHA